MRAPGLPNLLYRLLSGNCFVRGQGCEQLTGGSALA